MKKEIKKIIKLMIIFLLLLCFSNVIEVKAVEENEEENNNPFYKEGEVIIQYEQKSFASSITTLSIDGIKKDYIVADTARFTDVEFDSSKKPMVANYNTKNPKSTLAISLIKSDKYSTEELIDYFKNLDWVISVEPNFKIKPLALTTDPYEQYQWAIENNGQDSYTSGLDINTITSSSSTDKVIAIVDTGVDYNHEDLKNRMWVNPYSSSQLPGTYGYDYINNDSDPMDDIGHGTHVAGIIAGEANNGKGITGTLLDASNYKLMSLKILTDDENVDDSFTSVNAYNYIYKAQQLGTNVVAINNSWGGYASEYEYQIIQEMNSLKTVIDLVGQKGALTICAAGNESQDLEGNGYTYMDDNYGHSTKVRCFPVGIDSDYIVGVAATNGNDKLALFSNTGDCVDIAAPGTGILSSVWSGVKEFTPGILTETEKTNNCEVYMDFENSSSIPFSVDYGTLSIVSGKSFGTGNKCLKWDLNISQSSLGYQNSKFVRLSYNNSGSHSCYMGAMVTAVTNGSTIGVTCNNTYETDDYIGLGSLSGDSNSFMWGNVYGNGSSGSLAIYAAFSEAGHYEIYIDNFAITKNSNTSNLKPYAYYSGTSMASPYVAGAVGVIANYYENETALQRKNRLLSCVRKTSGLNGKVTTGGVIDLSKLEVNVDVKSIELPSTATVNVGNTITLTPTYTPSNATDKTVTWSSSDTSVATVSNSGVVTGVKKGIVTITAKTKNNKTANCVVTVKQPATGIKFNYSGIANLKVGETRLIDATLEPEDTTDTFDDVQWSSSNPSVITINEHGYVTGISVGTASIYGKIGNTNYMCFYKVTEADVLPTGISLNNNSISINVGDTDQLTATVTPSNATNKTVTWSSDKTGVATVDQTGKVTAVSVGTAKITAKTSNNIIATCTVTVTNPVIEATGITLNKTSTTIEVGKTETLTATITPSNATDKTVTWSSADSSIATVDQTTGKVTGIKAGNVTIQAKTKNDLKALCIVTVKNPVIEPTGISLDRTQATVTKGAILQLIATVTPTNATDKTVTWSSSDTNIATIDEYGRIVTKKVGTVTITASTSNNLTATCRLTIEEVKPFEIQLNKTELNLQVNDSETLIATVIPDEAVNKEVTWTTNDINVATVDPYGVVTGVGEGYALITVRSKADTSVYAICRVYVGNPTIVEPTGISLNKSSTTIYVNGNETLTATISPSNAVDKTILWSSEDPNIATVDNTGKITGVASGETTIIASTVNNIAARCTVSVIEQTVEPTGINLNKTISVINIGGTDTLTATITPENATDKTVTWSSNKPEVATVENGVVTRNNGRNGNNYSKNIK